ncbi:hypothetical protein PISMIDRAFT_609295 [Pisolithus microcarpus 441]|uniref:Uncharacterized protein n=1 Tax=Pisolithus microcarpus 441 TaxID=765257 RepID=A0A0C9ZG15_9AGAM|nr:hypothetical protein PISMIDRAFT_609295 [Pisolithus microcarpus 441]
MTTAQTRQRDTMSLVSNVLMQVRLGESFFVSASFWKPEAISTEASVSPDFAEHTVISRMDLLPSCGTVSLHECPT